MYENLQKYNIILASNSPRRRDLLQRMGLTFKVKTLLGIDESYPPMLKGEEIVKYISEHKAAAYKESMTDDDLLITADTIVCIDDKVLGKPHDEMEAHRMLDLLAGRTHQVITGVTVSTKNKKESFAVITHVKMSVLSSEEIDYYITNNLPFDKAGSYGIQEWIGMIAVEDIRGSYWNVMGLPVTQLYKVLKKF